MLLRASEYLRNAEQAERRADAETRDELQALYRKSAQSWRALATMAVLAEETKTTEFD